MVVVNRGGVDSDGGIGGRGGSIVLLMAGGSVLVRQCPFLEHYNFCACVPVFHKNVLFLAHLLFAGKFSPVFSHLSLRTCLDHDVAYANTGCKQNRIIISVLLLLVY